MSEKQEKALAYFASGRNCAQAVLLAFAEEIGLSEADALQLAGCLGGGMGCGEVCGTVSGAMLVLGKKNLDVNAPDQAAEKMRVRKIGADFIRRFKEQHTCVTCRDLLKLNQKQMCPQFISDVVGMIEEAG